MDELDAVIDAVESLDEAGWRSPTRCPPWTVRQLAAHLAMPPRALANGLAALRHGDTSSKGGEPLPATMVGPQVCEALKERRDQVDAALGALTPTELDAVLPPPTDNRLELPTSTLLRLSLVEIGVHRSDLSAALGAPDALSEAVTRAVADVVPMWLIFESASAPQPNHALSYHLLGDTVDISFAYQPTAGWSLQTPDDVADCSVTGSDSDLGLLLLGRRPPDHPALSTSAPALLASFKVHLPGP